MLRSTITQNPCLGRDSAGERIRTSERLQSVFEADNISSPTVRIYFVGEDAVLEAIAWCEDTFGGSYADACAECEREERYRLAGLEPGVPTQAHSCARRRSWS